MVKLNRFPLSYTSLNSFETCPRRFYITKVTKQIIEPENEVLRWGNTVHQAIENYIKEKTPLPQELEFCKAYVDMLLTKPGEILVEHKLTIDKDFNPTDWWSPTAWLRGKIDLCVLNKEKAIIIDWKTGKRKQEFDQLKLFALLLFSHYPDIQKIDTAFIWLQEKKLDKYCFEKDMFYKLWQDFLPKIERLERAFEENNWLPKPSSLCQKWCPVNKMYCEFGRDS